LLVSQNASNQMSNDGSELLSDPSEVTVQPHFDPVDQPESVGNWFTRLIKGIVVGIGFILPGLSGGVLAVILKIYDPMIRFLAHPTRKFVKNLLYFIPVGIGGVIGVIFFSIVVEAAFGKYAAIFICLFIGFVIGTLPSLFKQAAKQGRSTKHWVILGVSTVAIFALMMLGSNQLVAVPTSIPVWFGSGALIGLGVIVPGMSPSNFLIYFGLYDKMAAGIAALDMAVCIPLFVGLVACVLLFSKAADWAFNVHYAGMYHFILGMVIGSSLAIFPTQVFPSFSDTGLAEMGLSMGVAVALAVLALVVGGVLSWLFSRVEDRVQGQREELEAAAKS